VIVLLDPAQYAILRERTCEISRAIGEIRRWVAPLLPPLSAVRA